MASTRRVLIIAASDSSGGAGLTRDVATLAELGTETRCAVTAVTVQTDREVRATHVLAADLIAAQIRAALAAGDIGAIKIGMLGRRETVRAVLETLPPRADIPIVLDPVLLASSGGTLLDAEGRSALRSELLPRITLLTPNIPEAAALLDQPMDAEGDLAMELLEEQARALLRLGPSAVLLKGGHARGARVIDILAREGESLLHLAAPRIARQRRGTGCSLASAIAAHLAAGRSLVQACSDAQAYVGQALQRDL
jgi:hydroxymethylpyrimidine/phosphomethylpyrimidine kinase